MRPEVQRCVIEREREKGGSGCEKITGSLKKIIGFFKYFKG